MKKIVRILLVFALFLTFFASVSTVFAANEVAISDSHVDCVAAGKDVSTTISLDKGTDVIGFQLKLKYDSDKYTYKDIENIGLTKKPTVNSNTLGELLFVYSDTTAIKEGSQLFKLTFTVKETTADGDTEFLSLDGEYTHKFTCFNQEVGQTVTSNVTGQFAGLHVGLYGDVNNDGVVSINDVTLIQLYVSEFREFTDAEKNRADVFKDGVVDIADAARIQLYLAGMLTTLQPVSKLIVSFVDMNNELIEAVAVEEGESADAPEAPVVDGYDFIGWDKDFSKVTENMTVKALYEAYNQYTITFIADEKEVATYNVREGKSLTTIPEVPAKEGFKGYWDITKFENVISDINVIAVYISTAEEETLASIKETAINEITTLFNNRAGIFSKSLTASEFILQEEIVDGTTKTQLTLTDNTMAGDDGSGYFTILADKENTVVVDDNTKTYSDLTFTRRIKLTWIGSTNYRSIAFKLSSDSIVTVYAMSASSTATDRTLNVLDENGKTCFNELVSGTELQEYTIKLSSGMYYLTGLVGAINIYGVNVKEQGFGVDPAILTSMIADINACANATDVQAVVDNFDTEYDRLMAFETALDQIYFYVNSVVTGKGTVSFVIRDDNDVITGLVVTSSGGQNVLVTSTNGFNTNYSVGDVIQVKGTVYANESNFKVYEIFADEITLVTTGDGTFNYDKHLSEYTPYELAYYKVSGMLMFENGAYYVNSSFDGNNFYFSVTSKEMETFSKYVNQFVTFTILLQDVNKEYGGFNCKLVNAEVIDIETKSISEINQDIISGNTGLVQVVGQVNAFTNNGFYINDGTGTIFIYMYDFPNELEIGSNVQILGYSSIYYNLCEINDVISLTINEKTAYEYTASSSTILEIVNSTYDKIISHDFYTVSGLVIYRNGYYYLFDINTGASIIIYENTSYEDLNKLSKYSGQYITLDVMIHDYHSSYQAYRLIPFTNTIVLAETSLKANILFVDNNYGTPIVSVGETNILVFANDANPLNYFIFFTESTVNEVTVISSNDDGIESTKLTLNVNGKANYIMAINSETGAVLYKVQEFANDLGLAFPKKEITVTFIYNEVGESYEQNMYVGSLIIQGQVHYFNGYNFVGWYLDSEYTNALELPFGIFEDTTLYGKLEIIDAATAVDITIHVLDTTTTYTYANGFYLVADAMDNLQKLIKVNGYTFAGFYLDNTYEKEFNNMSLTESIDIYVKLIAASEMTIEKMEDYSNWASVSGTVSATGSTSEYNYFFITDNTGSIGCYIPKTIALPVVGSVVTVSGEINRINTGSAYFEGFEVADLSITTVGEGTYDFGTIEPLIGDMGLIMGENNKVYSFECFITLTDDGYVASNIYGNKFIVVGDYLNDFVGKYGEFNAYFVDNNLICLINNEFVEKEVPSLNTTLYVQVPDGWANVYLCYINYDNKTGVTEWPGVQMTLVEGTTNLYSYEIPYITDYLCISDGIKNSKYQFNGTFFYSFNYYVFFIDDNGNLDYTYGFANAETEVDMIIEYMQGNIDEIDSTVDFMTEILNSTVTWTSSDTSILQNDGTFIGSLVDTTIYLTARIICREVSKEMTFVLNIKAVEDADYLGLTKIVLVSYLANDTVVKTKGTVSYVYSKGFMITNEDGYSIYVYNKDALEYSINVGDIVIVNGIKATYNGTSQIYLTSIIDKGIDENFNLEISNSDIHSVYYSSATQYLVGDVVRFSGKIIFDGTNYYICGINNDSLIIALMANDNDKQVLSGLVGNIVMVTAMYYNYYTAENRWNLLYISSETLVDSNMSGFWKGDNEIYYIDGSENVVYYADKQYQYLYLNYSENGININDMFVIYDANSDQLIIDGEAFVRVYGFNGETSQIVIYAKAPSDWTEVYLYYWGSVLDSVEWPGKAMTLVEGTTDVYAYTLPYSVTGFVFTVSSGKDQTVNAYYSEFIDYYIISESIEGSLRTVTSSIYDPQREFDLACAYFDQLPTSVSSDINMSKWQFPNAVFSLLSSNEEVLTSQGEYLGAVEETTVTFTIVVTLGELTKTITKEIVVAAVEDVDYIGVKTAEAVCKLDDNTEVKARGTVTYIGDNGFIMSYEGLYIYVYNKNSIAYPTEFAVGQKVIVAGTKGTYNQTSQIVVSSVILKGVDEEYVASNPVEMDISEINSYVEDKQELVGKAVTVLGKIIKSGNYYYLQSTDGSTRIGLIVKSNDSTVIANALDTYVIMNGVLYNYYANGSIWNMFYDSDSLIAIPMSSYMEGYWKEDTETTLNIIYINLEEFRYYDADGKIYNELKITPNGLFDSETGSAFSYDAASDTLFVNGISYIRVYDFDGSTEEPVRSIAEVLELIENGYTKAVKVQGVVIAKDTSERYYIYDGTGVLSIYQADLNVQLYDEVIVKGLLATYTSSSLQHFRQLTGEYELVEIVSHNNTYYITDVTYDITSYAPLNSDTTLTSDLLALINSSAYINTFIKIQGVVSLTDDSYKNIIITMSDEEGNSSKVLVYYTSTDQELIKTFVGATIEMNVAIIGYDVKNGCYLVTYSSNFNTLGELDTTVITNVLQSELNDYFSELSDVSDSVEFLASSQYQEYLGNNYVSYTYTSSNEEILSSDGLFTLPSTDTDITITVVVTLNENELFTATYTVKALSNAVLYKSTDFETANSFTASSIYNNTTEASFGPVDNTWKTYYGTVSTTSPLNGASSMQMRWYANAKTNLGYTYNTNAINNVSKIAFSAASTNGLNVAVSYSTDGGANWSTATVFTLTTVSTKYYYYLSEVTDNVMVKFTISLPETAPTSTSRLYIDDVEFYVIPFEVSFDSNGGSEYPSIITTETVDLSNYVPFLEGYTFAGWYTDSEFVNAFDQTTAITNDVCLYAKWISNTPAAYTITFDSNGGTPFDELTVTGLADLSNYVPILEGFTFAGWFMDSELTIAFDSTVELTSDITIYASWTAVIGE